MKDSDAGVPLLESSHHAGTDTRSQRAAARLATLVAATGMGFDAFVINLPVILILPVAALYHVSASRIAGIQTVFLGGYFLGTVGFATLADRAGRKLALAISIIGYGVAAALTGLAPTLTLFVLARGITGILAGGEMPVGVVYAAEAWPDKKRGWGSGNMLTLYPVGVMLLIVLALLVKSGLGLSARWVFVFALPLALLLFLFRSHVAESGRFTATRQQSRQSGLSGWAAIVRNKTLRRRWLPMLITNIGDNFSYHGFSVAFILYLHTFHRPQTEILYILLGLYAIQAVGSALTAYLADIIGRRVLGVGIQVIAMVSTVAMLQVHSFVATVAIAAVAQTLLLIPAWTVKLIVCAEVFPTEVRATGLAMTLGLGRSAAFLAPTLLVTLIPVLGIHNVLYIYLVSMLLSLLGYLFVPDLKGKPMADLVSQLPAPAPRMARLAAAAE